MKLYQNNVSHREPALKHVPHKNRRESTISWKSWPTSWDYSGHCVGRFLGAFSMADIILITFKVEMFFFPLSYLSDTGKVNHFIKKLIFLFCLFEKVVYYYFRMFF